MSPFFVPNNLMAFGNNTPFHWTNGNNVTYNGQETDYLCFCESRTPQTAAPPPQPAARPLQSAIPLQLIAP